MYLEFLGSWVNTHVHYLFYLIATPFGRPDAIGGLLTVVCPWGLLYFMKCTLTPVYAITVLGSKSIIGFFTTELA